MSDTLVALFNSFFSCGMITGPLIGSYLTLGTDFRFCSDFEALLLAVFFVVYLTVVYIPLKLKEKKANASAQAKRVYSTIGNKALSEKM